MSTERSRTETVIIYNFDKVSQYALDRETSEKNLAMSLALDAPNREYAISLAYDLERRSCIGSFESMPPHYELLLDLTHPNLVIMNSQYSIGDKGPFEKILFMQYGAQGILTPVSHRGEILMINKALWENRIESHRHRASEEYKYTFVPVFSGGAKDKPDGIITFREKETSK
jgi:hypothetical protein